MRKIFQNLMGGGGGGFRKLLFNKILRRLFPYLVSLVSPSL